MPVQSHLPPRPQSVRPVGADDGEGADGADDARPGSVPLVAPRPWQVLILDGGPGPGGGGGAAAAKSTRHTSPAAMAPRDRIRTAASSVAIFLARGDGGERRCVLEAFTPD